MELKRVSVHPRERENAYFLSSVSAVILLAVLGSVVSSIWWYIAPQNKKREALPGTVTVIHPIFILSYNTHID